LQGCHDRVAKNSLEQLLSLMRGWERAYLFSVFYLLLAYSVKGKFVKLTLKDIGSTRKLTQHAMGKYFGENSQFASQLKVWDLSPKEAVIELETCSGLLFHCLSVCIFNCIAVC